MIIDNNPAFIMLVGKKTRRFNYLDTLRDIHISKYTRGF